MASLRDYLQPSISPDEAQYLSTQVAPSSEFERGITAHEVQSNAGDLYSQSLDAELNHDLGAASALRAKAAKTMSFMPKMATRDEDFGRYAAGTLGEIAPELPKFAAAGILGRAGGSLLGASRLGEFAGAAVPGYQLSRRGAITEQEQDPAVMATSPEARSASATRQGLVGGIAGAIPISHALQSATRPGLRGLFQGAATTAGEMAGVNTGLAAYGQHELSGLDPNRDTSHDTEALKEAAISGAIGGAGMHGAFAVPGLPFRAFNEAMAGANALPRVARAGVEAAQPLVERAQDLGEQGAGVVGDTAGALKDRFGPAVSALAERGKDFATRGFNAASDAAQRVPEAVRSASDVGDFLSKVVPSIKRPPEEPFQPTAEDQAGPAPDAAPTGLVGKSAAEIFNTLKARAKQSPEQVQAYYQKAADALGGDFNPTTQDGQRKIVDALKVRANAFGGKLNDFVNAMQGRGESEGEKSSYLTSKAKPALENTVFNHLTDEARKDPDVVEKLPQLTDALSQFMARSGSLGKDDVQAITGYKRLESMFSNPDALEKDLGQALQLDAKELTKIRGISSAAKDAGTPNSFLYSSLTDQAKDSMKSGQLRQVGDLVDRMTTADDATFKNGLKQLTPVFGTEEKARRVLDFYANNFKDKVGVDIPDRVLGLSDERDAVHPGGASDEGNNLGSVDEGHREYVYKDHGAARPFFAGEDTSKAAERARAEGQNVSAVNHLDFVHEHGIDVEGESTRLQKDAQDRLGEIVRKGQGTQGAQRQELVDRYQRLKPQVDLMQKVMEAKKPVNVAGHGIVQPGHEGVVQLHTMLATEPRGAESQAHASPKEMGKYGAPKSAAESIKSTLVNANLKDPVTGTVKPRTFSLEAMARHELQANPSEYGNIETRPEKLRAAASRGLAKIAARPDFQGFEKSARGNALNDLVVHRQSDTRMDLTKRETKAAQQWTPEQVEALTKGKESLRGTLDKFKAADATSRAELATKVQAREATLRGEAEGVGPAAAYAKRRAELLGAAREKMSSIERNERIAGHEEGLRKEHEIPEEPKTLAEHTRATRDVEDARADAVKAMRDLLGKQAVKTDKSDAYDIAAMRGRAEKAGKGEAFRDLEEQHMAAKNIGKDLAEQKFELKKEEKTEELGGDLEARNQKSAEDKAITRFSRAHESFGMYGRENEQGRLGSPNASAAEKLGAKGTSRRVTTIEAAKEAFASAHPEHPDPTGDGFKAFYEAFKKDDARFNDMTLSELKKELSDHINTFGEPEEGSSDVKRDVLEERIGRLEAEDEHARENKRAENKRADQEKSRNPSQAKDGAGETKESQYVNQGAGPAQKLSAADKQAIKDEFVKTVGPHVELRFEKAMGGKAGSYKPATEKTKAIVRAVMASANETQGTVWHESLHHLFKVMGENAKSDVARTAYRDLKQVAQMPNVQRQLRELLKNSPKALEQLSGPDRVEESMAYMYQFWRAGDRDGQRYINFGDKTGIQWFDKLRNFFYNALGVVSKTGKVEAIMSAFAEGKLSNESTIDAALRDIREKTLRDRLDHFAPGVGKAYDALLLGATDRLRSFGYNSFDKLADKFHKEPDREHGSLGFLQHTQMVKGQEMNRFQDGVGNPTHVEISQALENLQSMKKPSTPLEKNLRKTLDHLFQYMDKSGVEMKNEKGDWVPINQRYGKDYFPRVWDKRAVDANRDELRQLFIQEGKMDRSKADDIITSMLGGDGLLDLAENEHHIGFTPANQALTARALDFITSKNAGLFTKYQSKDLNEIMSKYIYQAVHRAEYAKAFGNDGEVIRAAMEQAKKEGASPQDLAAAQKAVMAMEGTLGHDFNPQLRKLFTGLTAYQNVVLLPFALLSSLSDAAGVSLRSGEFRSQFSAMKRGVQGIVDQMRGRGESQDKVLQRAKDFGIIDSMNMLENYGSIYNSAFMSPTLRKINDKFFKYNGMEMWNKQMRLAGFEAGQRFVLRELGNQRYMDELGLKQADLAQIKKDADGGIDFDALTPAVRARMEQAMFRFVDGAVLRPNAAQRPVWASDPAFMLIAHLKQFAFSFQNTFMKRYQNEMGHADPKSLSTSMKPSLLFLSFLPFGIFSGAVRRGLAGQGAFAGMSLASTINDGMMRSGMYGTGMFLEDAIGDVHRGLLPGTSFLGPTAEHAQKALEFATGGPESAHQLLLRSTPLSPLVKDFSPMPD